MKKIFLRTRWFFTMLLFVTTMIMPSMMLAEESITPTRPNGEGTAEKPYQIGNAAELYWFAGLVNGTLTGVKKNISANAKLMNNITVNEGVLDANKDLVSGKDFIPWTPIGTSNDDAYTGTFDGKGYTISGLYFNNPTSYYVGLFGCIGANGKISNVGVLDSYFQFCALGGGVCGKNNNGELQNCSNSSTVIGNKQDGTGGVCGKNYGTVRDCKNTGSVRGIAPLGGVCGVNISGIIENCFNEGTVSVTFTSVGGGSGVCGANLGGTTTNCYYLSNTATNGIGGRTDESGKAEKMSIEHFESGEVAWLLNGKGLGEQVWGQQLGIDPSPVPGSAYKVIKAAKGDKDANGNDTYWATFSNQTNNATLSVPSDRTLNVYNATVSGGKMTLTERDNQVAKDEGVLLKTDGEYVNAKANETNGLTKASSDVNHLVATPAEAQTVTAETGYKLYRLTYNYADKKEGLGFYLGSIDGTSLKATPGKAYLKVSENEAKDPSSAALTRSFVFGGGSETTGIDEITIMGTDVQRHGTIEGIFDLQGRKISNPTKGIYIKNNKKVIIK
ncbi:hypothetical protein RJT12_16620 [Segatella copri]|uniref:hypothetical protein n=1 Tax=Segatella copri TaxID=165179 RepID=UPI00294B5141|nr:hypothetical protein [Segatella copri]WOF97020.1 hypothetical protein RJT12_16620 [Segatella copri]